MKIIAPLLITIILMTLTDQAKAQQTDPQILKQQASADSFVASYYNPKRSMDEMRKSRNGKKAGYAMLAVGAGSIIYSLTRDEASAGIFWSGCLVMALSNPVLTGAAREKGRAEMLSMDPALYKTQEQRSLLLSKYKSTATGCTIGGWVLFLGGLATFTIAASSASDPDAGLIAGTASMMASLPVWMVGAKNKGRISVLSGRYTGGRSLSMTPAQRGIGLAVNLGK